MDEISAAAMWTDAGVTESHSFTILRHLRFSLGGKITVPCSRIKDLHIGVTTPQIGSTEWQDPDSGRVEMIQCEYKSMIDEYKFGLTKLLTSHSVWADDVDDIDFVIGGDHGKGKEPLYCKTTCAKVFYKKDSAEILDRTIMPWLTRDTKNIHNSSILLTNFPFRSKENDNEFPNPSNGATLCDFMAKNLTKLKPQQSHFG